MLGGVADLRWIRIRIPVPRARANQNPRFGRELDLEVNDLFVEGRDFVKVVADVQDSGAPLSTVRAATHIVWRLSQGARMTKFLRKYQKFLLVIFASGLMVVFVAPQALTRYGKGLGKRTEVYIGEKSISTLDLQQAGREREAVGTFISAATGSTQYASILTGEDSLHWILLTHAAREAGFIGEAGDGVMVHDVGR